jgi:lysophospholipase L1-like esterase
MNSIRMKMDAYGASVKEIAKKYNAAYVDTQAALYEILEHYYSAAINWDRIHPNTFGHTVIARAFLNAVGFEWRY